MLPPSRNDRYHGSPLAAHFLTLVGVLTVVPGAIHTSLPDGGAGVIAGLDLSHGGPVIVGVFAWAGATQLAWGTAMLVVSRRYRDLVPLLLGLVLAERSLMALNIGWLKAPTSSHRPPEAYASLIAVPLVAAALVLSLRGTPRAGHSA